MSLIQSLKGADSEPVSSVNEMSPVSIGAEKPFPRLFALAKRAFLNELTCQGLADRFAIIGGLDLSRDLKHELIMKVIAQEVDSSETLSGALDKNSFEIREGVIQRLNQVLRNLLQDRPSFVLSYDGMWILQMLVGIVQEMSSLNIEYMEMCNKRIINFAASTLT